MLVNEGPSETQWEVDMAAAARDGGGGPVVFKLDTSKGVIPRGGSAKVRVTFTPEDTREYHAQAPMYLDGDRSRSCVARVRESGFHA